MPFFNRFTSRTLLLASATILLGGACATLQQIAALRRVTFSIDRVAEARLANVSLARITNYRDLSAVEIAAIATNLARGALPFDFNLHLSALNPADNGTTARLVQLDWLLLLDDRETISGRTDREFLLEPGIAGDIPINIRIDLAEYFERNAGDMIDLALAVAGVEGTPKRISLRATPTIQTPLGPIRYPEPITIVSGTVGVNYQLRP
jgi:hypothetical protein